MQKGRVLLTVFFLALATIMIISTGILVFKVEAKKHNRKSYPVQRISGGISSFTIPTFTPTPIPSSTPTPTPQPTITPTSTPTPIPTASQKVNTVNTTSSPNDYILQKVNEYRASMGLSSVSANSETCSFAQTRAQEISSSQTFNHDGFTNRVNSRTLPYPSYHEVTENIAYNTDYKDVVNRWIASAGHAENMRKDTPYVCVRNYGDYYAYEGWRP